MAFSKFLDSKRQDCKSLVAELKKHFAYVSVLGVDIKTTGIRVDRNTSNIGPGADTECGFVVKMHNGTVFCEYSLDDIAGDIPALAAKIAASVAYDSGNTIAGAALPDEPLVQSFARGHDLADYTEAQLLDFCKEQCATLLGKSEYLLNGMVSLRLLEVSKLFISENRELDQNYSWVNGIMVAIYKENDKVVQAYESANYHRIGDVLAELPTKQDKLLHTAHCLTLAEPIEPGVYDVITDPSITGLIAHEAFGHGVEMDQFVKDRALAKEYVGKYVASPICNMRDGAASTLSAASYFFDDDGVLAGDTQIIKDGKLTDNYVSPVVMSGYVPDLLKSISMVSDDFVVTGMGSCGKGYKEWVRVSDGGPALKVKVKLG